MKTLKLITAIALIAVLAAACGPENPEPGPTPDPDPKPNPTDTTTHTNPADTTTTKTFPVIEGTFLQHWYTVYWDDARWDSEMDVLKEAGITYLIYTPIKDGGNDADLVSLGKCLKSAKKHDIKIFVGPNYHSDWWSQGRNRTWLMARMEEGKTVIASILNRFQNDYKGTLYGWYWDWEIDNLNWNSDDAKQLFVVAINVILDAIPEDTPLIFSPFANPSLGSAASYGKFWKEVLPKMHFREGDIFSPQDCVGATRMAVANVKGWFYQYQEATALVQGLQLWGNVETFEQFSLKDGSHFASAPLGRIVEQMEAVDKFVSKIICFAYPHYQSPNNVLGHHHEAYKNYVKTGQLETCPVPKAVSSATKEVGTGVSLTWVLPTKDNADGFAIYKNSELYIKLQITPTLTPNTFFDQNGRAADTYQIATYNYLGEESNRVAF